MLRLNGRRRLRCRWLGRLWRLWWLLRLLLLLRRRRRLLHLLLLRRLRELLLLLLVLLLLLQILLQLLELLLLLLLELLLLSLLLLVLLLLHLLVLQLLQLLLSLQGRHRRLQLRNLLLLGRRRAHVGRGRRRHSGHGRACRSHDSRRSSSSRGLGHRCNWRRGNRRRGWGCRGCWRRRRCLRLRCSSRRRRRWRGIRRGPRLRLGLLLFLHLSNLRPRHRLFESEDPRAVSSNQILDSVRCQLRRRIRVHSGRSGESNRRRKSRRDAFARQNRLPNGVLLDVLRLN